MHGDQVSTQFQRNPAIEAAPMQDETILFDPATNKFCMLNGTAAFLWERLAAPCTAEQLASAVCGSFAGVSEEAATRDVRGALDQFSELSFVVAAHQ